MISSRVHHIDVRTRSQYLRASVDHSSTHLAEKSSLAQGIPKRGCICLQEDIVSASAACRSLRPIRQASLTVVLHGKVNTDSVGRWLAGGTVEEGLPIIRTNLHGELVAGTLHG